MRSPLIMRSRVSRLSITRPYHRAYRHPPERLRARSCVRPLAYPRSPAAPPAETSASCRLLTNRSRACRYAGKPAVRSLPRTSLTHSTVTVHVTRKLTQSLLTMPHRQSHPWPYMAPYPHTLNPHALPLHQRIL